MNKSFIKNLQIIHIILCAGVLSFILIAYFISSAGMFSSEEKLPEVFDYIVPGLIFLIPFAGVMAAHKKNSNLREGDFDLNYKKENYRKAFMIRMATLETAAFFGIVIFLLTGDLINLAYAVVALAFMIIQYPAAYKVADEMGVKEQDLK